MGPQGTYHKGDMRTVFTLHYFTEYLDSSMNVQLLKYRYSMSICFCVRDGVSDNNQDKERNVDSIWRRNYRRRDGVHAELWTSSSVNGSYADIAQNSVTKIEVLSRNGVLCRQ